MDEDLDPHPCEEDEEFFNSRPDQEEMEHAISKFLGGMPFTWRRGKCWRGVPDRSIEVSIFKVQSGMC